MAFLDETGLAELWKLIKAEDAGAVADRSKIATGSYTGTGTSGSANPNTLTLGFKPKVLFVKARENNGWRNDSTYRVFIDAFMWTNGMTRCTTSSGIQGYNRTNYFTVSETGISWYADSSYYGVQLNNSGTVYDYVAFG